MLILWIWELYIWFEWAFTRGTKRSKKVAWWRGGLEGFCFDPILTRHTPPHPNIKATTIAHIDHTSKQAANQELERWLPISTMLSQASSSLCYFHCSCSFNLVHIHHTFPSCLCIFIVYLASQSINLNYWSYKLLYVQVIMP